MGRTQKPARPPFAFPLCRDSLCNTYSIGNSLWYVPIKVTLKILEMLRSKRYYVELVWLTRKVGGELPEAILAQEVIEEDGDRWLAEKLDLGDKPLLDFLAEVFVEHFQKSKGSYSLGSHASILLISPDSERQWQITDIDFRKRKILVLDSSLRSFLYPMPRNISPYSDMPVGNTGATWGALMKAFAFAFFTREEDGREVLLEAINKRIIDRYGIVVCDISTPLSRIEVTGKEVTLAGFVQRKWYKGSNPNLSISVASVDSIYLPAVLAPNEVDFLFAFEYDLGRYEKTRSARLYLKPNGSRAFVKVDAGTYLIKASVKAYGDGKVKLALDKNTWIRILMSSKVYQSIGSRKHREAFSFHFIIHLSRHEGQLPKDKSGRFVTRTDCPISVIKLLAERFSSVGL